MANDWTTCLIAPALSIRGVIAVIDRGARQIAMVVDEERRLLGVVTDGDIRRAILRGVSLDEPVEVIMNRKPQVGATGWSRGRAFELMQTHSIRQLPIVDAEGRVVDLISFEAFLATRRSRRNPVVLMAGGLGTRLRPLTEAVPKPMLDLGGRPILERILAKFIAEDFTTFFISVHYRGEIIKDHFGDGAQHGVTIRYLDEREPLGTAGALSLLPERPTEPIVVMNGDLLTDVNPGRLLDFHLDRRAVATMAVREYDVEVPFGVVETAGPERDVVSAIREKPVHRFLVNAGIYVLNHEVLDHIAGSTRLDMPTLLNRLITAGERVAAFPIHEAWVDIGRLDELERVRLRFTCD